METETPALIINRLCGSGFQSVVNIAHEILMGEAKIGIAGGTESMSQAPMAVYGQDVRFGTVLGKNLGMQACPTLGPNSDYSPSSSPRNGGCGRRPDPGHPSQTRTQPPNPGPSLGLTWMQDTLWAGLTDSHAGCLLC